MNKTKVAVVEDQSIINIDLKKSLTEMGFEVCSTFFSAEAALKEIDDLSIDVLIVDISLGSSTLDGIELVKEIHRKRFIPVIYLTAAADEETINRAKRTSPYAYLLKPYKKAELRISVELTAHRAHQESGGAGRESITVCSNCKKINTEEGEWVDLEEFIESATGLMPSHGICPDCTQKLYKFIAKDDK